MHQISLPKCVLTPDGSNKVAEVKVSAGDFTVHVLLMDFDEQSRALYCFFCLFFALRGLPRDAQYTAAAGTPRQHETDDS